MMNKNIYVITGGLGSGKTSILNILKQKGFFCIEEGARLIIKKEIKKGSKSLPWIDKDGFHRLVLKEMLKKFKETPANQTCFSDRGVPDVISYYKSYKMAVPKEVKEISNKYRYKKTVFLAPAWKEIYTQDDERKETFEEATKIYEQIKKAYEKLGYKVIVLPKVSAKERVKLILDKIEKVD